MIYIYNIKSTMVTDEKMKTAIGSDIDTIQTTVDDTIKWLDDSSERTTEDYEAKQKEVEGIMSPIIQKGYQSNMPAGESAPSEPKVEEVD